MFRKSRYPTSRPLIRANNRNATDNIGKCRSKID
jgi:hypothetical protein